MESRSNHKNSNENAFANEYSYLNLKRDTHDKLNCLSIDLERLRKNKSALPSITSERKNLIKVVSEKLRILKEKMRERETQREVFRMPYPENIVPLPINYSMPMPMPQMPYPFPFQQCPCNTGCHNHHCNQNQPKKPRKRAKKQKKQPKPIPQTKPKRKNRFRIYAYAVYFCIYFRHYSPRFTENRRKWFMDRYNRKDGGIIYEGSEKVLQKLHDLDFYQMSLDSKVTKHISGIGSSGQTVIDWEDYTKTALVPQNTTQRSEKGRETISQYVINFTELLMDKISQLLLDQQFIVEYHEVFSAGSLDLSFMIDNLYLPEETPFLFVHPTKGYLRLSYQQEIQLLLVKVMVKMIIFNFLLGLSRSKSWTKKLESQYKLAQFQVEEVWEIARTIGIYLYIICKDLYVLGVQNLKHNSNFYELCKRFGVRQAKSLEQVAIIQNQQQENRERKFELIRNIKNFEITEQKITRNSRLMAYKSVIQQKIIDLLANLHEKIKKQQRDLYAYIKNMTLTVPYLIFQSINRNKQEMNKKNRQYQILKPGKDKSGKIWNEIYGTHYKNGNNSISSDRSKSKNVKFDDSLDTNDPKTRGKMMVGRQSNEASNRDTSLNSQQNKQNKAKGPKFDVQKSYQMKKPFNVDTVNGKYDANRQDRLRQKFRNFLAKNEQAT